MSVTARPAATCAAAALLLLLLLVLVLGACDDDEATQPVGDAGAGSDASADGGGVTTDAATDAAMPGAGDARTVQLRFAARFGAQSHECGASYPAQGSAATEVSLGALKLYVHDVRLITAGGDEVPVTLDERAEWQIPEVALLDLAGPRGCTPAGTRPVMTSLAGAAGDYRGIVFSNGVPQALNHADPVTLSGPLQAPGMHWTWLTGFRFIVAEVQEVLALDAADTADDADAGGAVPRGAGVLHVGSVGCSGSLTRGEIECAHPNRSRVQLDGFDPDRDVIGVDLSALFEENDLSTASLCHSAEPLCEPMFERFGLDWDTGESLATQRVFRVVPNDEAAP